MGASAPEWRDTERPDKLFILELALSSVSNYAAAAANNNNNNNDNDLR